MLTALVFATGSFVLLALALWLAFPLPSLDGRRSSEAISDPAAAVAAAIAPVSAQPMLTPTETEDTPDEHFGESIFAENRDVWDRLNRAASYVLDLTAKASDPRKKVFSLDGTKGLDASPSVGGQQSSGDRYLAPDTRDFVEVLDHRGA